MQPTIVIGNTAAPSSLVYRESIQSGLQLTQIKRPQKMALCKPFQYAIIEWPRGLQAFPSGLDEVQQILGELGLVRGKQAVRRAFILDQR